MTEITTEFADGYLAADGSIITCPEVWTVARTEGGGRYLIPVSAPIKIKWNVSRPDSKIGPADRIEVWLDAQDRPHTLGRTDPLPPALAKEAGMLRAYESAGDDRANFEALLYEVATGWGPERGLLSANDVWTRWRGRGFPEPAKRNFVGPAMRVAERKGYIEFVGMVESTTGNGHSGLPNRGYRSLIAEGANA